MNVLFHCVYYPPEVGGLESHVAFLARGLAKRGHRVSVVTSRSIPEAPARETLDGVEVIRTWFPGRNPLGWSAHAAGSIPQTFSLARDADIIHAQAFASVPPCTIAKWTWGCPFVATFHTSHFLTRAGKDGWRTILGQLVRAPDHVLAASLEIAKVAEGLAPGATVEALPNGVDTDFFRRTPPALVRDERPLLVVPRRLFPKNGVEFFVRAMPRILQHRDVRAVLIGDGPERDRLEALADDLGVTHRMEFLGKQPHAAMPGLLSSGDLAVIPSLMEATSVAALEAMACELPVAASNVGGLPEIVGPDTGALFEAGDPGALAEAVVGLLGDPDLPGKGARARRNVMEFWSNDRLVDRHLEIYRDVISRRT